MVYTARIDALYDAACFEACRRAVEPERQRRIDACRSQDAGCRLLGAGLLLRHALSQNGIVAYETACDENGKPFLSSHPDVHFNLSHSGRMVMCAISDRPVGCDVQEIGVVSLERASRRFLTDAERAFADAVPSDERARMLTRLWALKESAVKLTGDGLRTPLSSFELQLGERVTLKGDFPFPDCFFFECDRFDGYHLAVCGLSASIDGWQDVTHALCDV